MSRGGPSTHPADADGADSEAAAFSALLEDSAEDLYENAPCGYLSTLMDGTIIKVNATLLDWLGYARGDVVGRRHFSDLLTVGGKLYHETHFAPLLQMQGEVGGVALDLKAAGGARLPVMVTSTVKVSPDGQPLLIRTTIFDARDRRAYERELLHARQVGDREQERLRRLVGALQLSLLPPTLPRLPGMEAAAYYHMASVDEVGGDFYDLFSLSDRRWGFFLGDVCGKGTEAAALTSLARYTLRSAAVYEPDPTVVLGNLNTVLYQQNDGDVYRYCTVVFGVLAPDGDGFTVTLASGGHPAPLLMRADGTAEYPATAGGVLVGILPDARYATTSVRLSPGDTLLLYTDGLTDARVDDGDARYGGDGLLAFGRGLGPTTAPAAISALTRLLNSFGSGLDDDAAVMALSVPSR